MQYVVDYYLSGFVLFLLTFVLSVAFYWLLYCLSPWFTASDYLSNSGIFKVFFFILSVIHCTVCVFVYNVCSVSAYTFQENIPQVLSEVVDWFDYYLFHVTWWDKVICGMSVAISGYSDFALILTLHILMIAMRMFHG